MKSIRHFVIVAVAGAVLVIVSACNESATVVWKGSSGRVPEDTPTPAGFSITPYQAQEIANHYFGPRKNVWHIYADSKNYYVVDGFLGSKASKADRMGLPIDGKTGNYKDLTTQEWRPNPLPLPSK